MIMYNHSFNATRDIEQVCEHDGIETSENLEPYAHIYFTYSPIA